MIPWIDVPRVHAASGIAGKVVFLDPGHNGANDASINRQVSNGRGGTKECQTTGTTTSADYPEHSFNWERAPNPRAAKRIGGTHSLITRK